jgi:LEA14-like dessication related protein
LPNDISIDTTHLLNPKMFVKFEINNPTNQPFNITKIYGTVNNGRTQIATINNNDLVTVAANGISSLNVQLNVDVVNLIEDVVNGNLTKEFIIDGYAMSGLVKIPFNKVLTIKIPSF